MDDWYQLTSEQALEKLNTNLEYGITSSEAAQRLETHGPNELVERGVKTPWQILFDQVKDTMVVVLIISAIISAVLGDLKDALAILAIVIINTLLGFRQEYQAEKAMAALKRMAVPTVRVKRNGHVQEISARMVVPGDLVLLEAGNVVPADGRVVESVNLRVQEAALTGESEPVVKEAGALQKEGLPIADRHNMVYMGTIVTYGRGEALITTTGMDTQLGGIAEMMQAAGQEDTPLQKRLDQLGKQLALIALGLVAVVFVLGLLRGESIRVLFLTAISLAVAAVPEGLPAVVTIALALGARRMLKREALIRKLPAVETLGSVTVICSDKTGTLTENRMTVTVMDLAEHRFDLTEEEHRIDLAYKPEPCHLEMPGPEQGAYLRSNPALGLLLTGGALCNDAILECEEERPEEFHIVGDPTEGALVVAAARMGLQKESLQMPLPRVAEIPFDSERKRMTTVHAIQPEEVKTLEQRGWPAINLLQQLPLLQPPADRGAGGVDREGINFVAFTKGAVDGLLDISTQVWVEDHVEPLNTGWRQRIGLANERLAQSGMRVLGVACRVWEAVPAPATEGSLETDLTIIGLFGMIDPARGEVKDAVQTCREAGIRPIMITGDHPLTARYIAQELGFLQPGAAGVMTGQQLQEVSDTELEEIVAHTSVFARVSPDHKLRIVQALQNQGQIAAMTGDGVNDAPALKKADIGVAMGITGTDVSKEAADMVLLNDNFATIVAAVEEGRVIYDNIRKFIKYTMTSNAGEIWVMLLSPFLGMPLALLPLQILWINLVTDGLPGLALGVENAEPNTMHRKPYPPNENIFARGVGRDILIVGLVMGIISLAVGYWYWRVDNPIWQTMVFTTLTLSEMGYVMAIRSNRYSLLTIGPFTNRALIGAVLLTTLLQLAVVYIPFLQNLFHTQALPFKDLLVCFVLSTSLLWVVEFEKWIIRKVSKE